MSDLYFFNIMSSLVLLAIMIAISSWVLFAYFEPKISIVRTVCQRRAVYILYNQWQGNICERKRKFLFLI